MSAWSCHTGLTLCAFGRKQKGTKAGRHQCTKGPRHQGKPVAKQAQACAYDVRWRCPKRVTDAHKQTQRCIDVQMRSTNRCIDVRTEPQAAAARAAASSEQQEAAPSSTRNHRRSKGFHRGGGGATMGGGGGAKNPLPSPGGGGGAIPRSYIYIYIYIYREREREILIVVSGRY